MASGKRTTPGADEGARRRRRAAPTIDLKATEVKPEPAAEAKSSPHSPHEQASAGPGGQARATASTQPSSFAGIDDWFRNVVTSRTVTAALAGGMVAALALMAMLLTGTMPLNVAGNGVSERRIAALETQLRELADRPVPTAGSNAVDALTERMAKLEEKSGAPPIAAPDNKAIDALAQRVDRLEQAKASPADPSIAERLAAAENAMKSLGIALTALNRRTDDIAGNVAAARERADTAANAAADLKGALQDTVARVARDAAQNVAPVRELQTLESRVDAIESAAKSARERATEASRADIPARLALAAAQLRDAVARGEPYVRELAAVKSLGADAAKLSPLESFAAQGVPGAHAMARDLSELVPAMLKAADSKLSGDVGFLERLQANAGSLVRIRPVDAPPGDNPGAVLARIEAAAARADIVAALAALKSLPDKVRAPATAWIEKAERRAAAIDASRGFASEAARALGRP